MKKETIEKIEGLISNLMQGTKIPSLAVSVIEEDKIIYSRAFGSRCYKQNLAATTNTLYGIGSCTKSFTCLGIMQLAEQGKLDINDPVSKYLPFNLGLKDKPITIHHLMSHSSGIPNLGLATVLIARHSFEEKETYVPLATFDDLMNFVNNAKDEVLVEPGKKYYYCNTAFTLLGAIIEKISGLKYEEYIKQNILLPLEMTHSLFTKEDYEKEKDVMTAYKPDTKNKGLLETIHPFDPFVFAAGGMLSSVNELSNYLLMILNNGKFNDKEILKINSLKKMFTPYIERQAGNFGKENYAYGWAVTEDFFGETLIQHGGSTAVSSAYLAFIPDKKIAVAVTGNVGNAMGGPISQVFLATLLGKNAMEELSFLRLEKKLSLLAGEYQLYKGLNKISIIKKGLTLFAKFPDEDCPAFQILPENDQLDDLNFYIMMNSVKFPIIFTLDKKTGKIDVHYERNIFHKIG